jgi:hypothetical protein
MTVFIRLLKYLLRYRVRLIGTFVCSALGKRVRRHVPRVPSWRSA